MEKISILWKTVKGTWNSSLLRKIKVLGRWNYEVAWKMEEGRGTKWQTILVNKILGENEKSAFYFYLKTKGTFWPTQYK